MIECGLSPAMHFNHNILKKFYHANSENSIMKQKVVVIGHGSTARLGLVRALAEADYDITVIVTSFINKNGKLNTAKPFDCYSKYINRILYIFAGESDGLIQLLLNECVDPKQKVVILPDSDFSASVIDTNQTILKDYFLFPHVNHTQGGVVCWMDKAAQKKLAEELGLNYARSSEIKVENKVYSIPPGILYPCFTKPKVTIQGGKQYFRKCDNEDQLRALLDIVGTKWNSTILAEEYINIETEYALLGFSDGNTVVIPGVIKFIRNSKSHFGIAMQGEVLPVSGFEELLKKFKQFVLKVGFVGVFDIDFFWGDGKWWFGEMNLRFGGSGYAITKMGVNLPVMLVKHLTNQNWTKMPRQVNSTATYVNERMCVDDWYKGYLSTREYKRVTKSADISFVYDNTDPDPQKEFEKEFKKIWVKRTIKKIIGKSL